MENSGEVWGRAPFHSGGTPAVQAYRGVLPPGRTGYEFTTPVRPTSGVPYQHGPTFWYRGTPGVRNINDDTVAIPVTITRVVRP